MARSLGYGSHIYLDPSDEQARYSRLKTVRRQIVSLEFLVLNSY